MKKIVSVVLLFVLLCFGLTACDVSSTGDSGPTTGTIQDATKYCDPNASLACKAVQRRYNLFSNADQYGYFYGFVQGNPEPLVVYITQGGVFPLDDLTTPPDKVTHCSTSTTGGNCVVQQNQQPDGTWGSNGDGWFGFRADGQYFEWVGMPHSFSFQSMPFRPAHIIGCPQTNAPALCH